MRDVRFIHPSTGPFERFQVGDSVAHISLGDGEVTKNDGTEIRVQYKNGCGIYDALWFQLNPKFLFHRRLQ